MSYWLARPAEASYPVLVHRVATLLHASFRHRLATTPLRFANPSPPSGWIEDVQAVDHARHTKNTLLSRRVFLFHRLNLFEFRGILPRANKPLGRCLTKSRGTRHRLHSVRRLNPPSASASACHSTFRHPSTSSGTATSETGSSKGGSRTARTTKTVRQSRR